MKPANVLIAASLALAAHSLVRAETSGKSLNQVRSEINSGTWQGITVYKSKPKADEASAAGAASAPAAAAPTAATVPATANSAAQATGRSASAPRAAAQAAPARAPADRVGALLRLDEPLSHQPMHSATRLDSPTLGIPLPTAAAGAASAAKR